MTEAGPNLSRESWTLRSVLAQVCSPVDECGVVSGGEGAVQAQPAASVRVFAVLGGDHVDVRIRELIARECCGAKAFVLVRDPDRSLGLLVGLCYQVKQQRQDGHPAVGSGSADRLVNFSIKPSRAMRLDLGPATPVQAASVRCSVPSVTTPTTIPSLWPQTPAGCNAPHHPGDSRWQRSCRNDSIQVYLGPLAAIRWRTARGRCRGEGPGEGGGAGAAGDVLLAVGGDLDPVVGRSSRSCPRFVDKWPLRPDAARRVMLSSAVNGN